MPYSSAPGWATGFYKTSWRKAKSKLSSMLRLMILPGFIVFLLFLCLLVAIHVVAGFSGSIDNDLQLQRIEALLPRGHVHDVDCRRVRMASDQCAYVRANCPDEEAGMISYLQFFYCAQSSLRPLAFAALVLWLIFLFATIGIAASDFFCINLSTISTVLGLSESLAGVTFLALGNGSPDVFSTFAAMRTHSGSMAIGELIGAAGFITAIVAGSMALVQPFKVTRKSFVRDVVFFIIAASFSIVFLADGHLSLWECIVMVAFYVFYVGFVVTWHWYLTRRRKRERELLARSPFQHVEPAVQPAGEVEASEDPSTIDRRSTQVQSYQIIPTVERNGGSFLADLDEDEEEERDAWLADISRNMRISRPYGAERRNTGKPIRPSLVGALEFRASLYSLQRSRNHQTTPTRSRRYSHDPSIGQQQNDPASELGPAPSQLLKPFNAVDASGIWRPRNDDDLWNATRSRAASTNDMDGLVLQPSATQTTTMAPAKSSNLPVFRLMPKVPLKLATATDGGERVKPTTPTIQLIPSDVDGDTATPGGPINSEGSPLLTPRSGSFLSPKPRFARSGDEGRSLALATHVPYSDLPLSPSAVTDSSTSALSTPPSAFPPYHDDPLSSVPLPSPMLSPSATIREALVIDDASTHTTLWWPKRLLPPPEVVLHTLFPTLCHWKDKTVADKLLGIFAVPSVFLLTITLPVVDIDAMEDAEETTSGRGSDDYRASRPNGNQIAGHSPTDHAPDYSSTLGTTGLVRSHTDDHIAPHDASFFRLSPSSEHALGFEETTSRETREARQEFLLNWRSNSYQSSSFTQLPADEDWNRWLVLTQTFTAPLFVVLVVWANGDGSLHDLLLRCLYSSIASLAALVLMLLSTSDATRPKYHYLLCFMGFIVAIAWISTIASEVVGVLKAFGIILGISDAIMGLTVFAVGNSLGDLVANVTVARLGFPVMALSACFGGPMLNILLGVGLGGIFMSIKGEHSQRPYKIEVGRSLIISGLALVVTLVGLLIAVPLNKWMMDRKIGWGLILLWSLATVGNIALETSGWSETQ